MDETLLVEKTHRLRQRLRLTRAFARGCAWASTGSLTALALVLVLKLAGRPWPELLVAFAALPLFVLGGALASWLKPPNLLQAALEADRVLDTKERLTTAVEWIVSERPRTAVAQSLLTDTLGRMSPVEPARTFPLRTGTSLKPSLLALTAALVLTALPAWSLFRQPVTPEELAVRRSARAISELAEALPKTAEARRLRSELEELARQLREPGVGREEAAARIGKKRQKLQGAAGAEGQEGESREGEERAERLQKLARAVESGEGSDGASGDIEREAAGLPENHPARKSLEQARQALQGQDPEQAAEALSRAAQQCRGAGQGQPGNALTEVDQALAEQQEILQPGSAGEQAVANRGSGQGGEGEGEGPADFGRGTTNEEEPPGGESPDYRLERQAEETSDWSEEYQRLYDPRRVDREAGDTRVPGQVGRGGLLPAPGEVRGAPGPGGESELTPAEIYLESRREAEQAVARESIPAEYRDTVRDYFDRIDPRPVPQEKR